MYLYQLTVILASFCASFFSGLLGIGGGIIIFPTFLYLIPMLGFESFSVNEITGIAATQALLGGYFAYSNHKKFDSININLVKRVIIFGIAGAFTGAVLAKFLSEFVLLLTYLVLLTIASILILKPHAKEDLEISSECKVEYPKLLNTSVILSTAIAGSLGFGGAITFIPILNQFCKASIKTAISTTTLIVFITTSVTFLGKAAVGLVPYSLIPALVFGSLFGAKLGSSVNRKSPPIVLRGILFIIVITIGIRILLTILKY